MKNINVKISTSTNIKDTAKTINDSLDGVKNTSKKTGEDVEKSFSSCFNQVTLSTNKLSKDFNKAFGGIIKTGTLVTGAIATGLTAFGVSSLNTFKEFESALANTSSIFGIEKGTLAYEELSNSARETAKVTSMTASESAEALGYMARAGWSAEESMASLTNMIKFAEASQSELVTSTDLITDSMDAYGLGASNLLTYLDAITYADNTVNATSLQIAESMKEVGGIFDTFNVDLYTSISLIASLSSIAKGSEAGNALSTIFSRLTSNTGEAKTGLAELGISAFDSQGNIRDMIDVVEDLSVALDGLSDTERARISKLIGGLNYTAEFNMLMSWGQINEETGLSQLRAYSKEISESENALEEKYEIMSDTITYAQNKFKSAFQELQIGAIEPHSEKIKNAIDSFVLKLEDATPKIQEGFGTLIDTAFPFFEGFIDLSAKALEHSDVLIPSLINLGVAFGGLVVSSTVLNSLATLLSSLKAIRTFLTAHPVVGGFLSNAGLLATGLSISVQGLGNYAKKEYGTDSAWEGLKTAFTTYDYYVHSDNEELPSNAKDTDYVINSTTGIRQTVEEYKRNQLLNQMPSAIISLGNNETTSTTSTTSRPTNRSNPTSIPTYSTGTSYFLGGLAEISEHGGEVVGLPSGSTIIPSDKSTELVKNIGSTNEKNIYQNTDKVENKNVTVNVYIQGNVIGNKDFVNYMGTELLRILKPSLSNV